jgi:hypothetical protein
MSNAGATLAFLGQNSCTSITGWARYRGEQNRPSSGTAIAQTMMSADLVAMLTDRKSATHTIAAKAQTKSSG